MLLCRQELLTEASGDRGRARSAPTVIEVPGGEPLPALRAKTALFL